MILLLFGFALSGISQDRYRVGLMPHLNINQKFSNDWKLNLKVESRQLVKERNLDGEVMSGLNYVLSDIGLLLTKKIALNNQIGGGYLIRFENNKMAHRSIQQFSIVKIYRTLRLSHRIVSDQTFRSNRDTQIRFRYRIGVDFALNGQVVDAGELYFKCTNEYLNIFQGDDYQLEIRIMPVLGYAFADRNKLEVGLDYRLDSFLDDQTRHNYWMKIGWYVSLDHANRK
jgi:hypothetical protein